MPCPYICFNRALTLDHATQTGAEIYETARDLLRKNWRVCQPIRLLGVQTSGFSEQAGQMDLLDGARHQRMIKALHAAERLRDKYGEGPASGTDAQRQAKKVSRCHARAPEREGGASDFSTFPGPLTSDHASQTGTGISRPPGTTDDAVLERMN